MNYEEVKEKIPVIDEDFFNKIKKESDIAHELNGKYFVYLSDEDAILEHDPSEIQYQYNDKDYFTIEEYIKGVKENDDKDEIKNVSREHLSKQYEGNKLAQPFISLAPTMEELNKMWDKA